MGEVRTFVFNTAAAQNLTPQEKWAVILIGDKAISIINRAKNTDYLEIRIPIGLTIGFPISPQNRREHYRMFEEIRRFVSSSVEAGVTVIACIGDDHDIAAAIARYTQRQHQARIVQDTAFCNTYLYKMLCDPTPNDTEPQLRPKYALSFRRSAG